MKIAIPTNDRKTITIRTGRAKEFAVFVKENGKIISEKYLANKHEQHKHDGERKEDEHSHKEIIDLIADVDLLVIKQIGKFMKVDIELVKIKYEFTEETDITEILKNY